MKKILLLLLPFVAAALTIRAQTIHYGVKGGLGLSSKTSKLNPVFPSFYGGGFANFKLNDHWSLQPEVIYSYNGQNQKFMVLHPGEPLQTLTFKTREQYLSIPVMVQYHITPKLYVEAGPEVSMLLDAKQGSAGNWQHYTSYYHRFTLAGSVGVGYKLPFGLGVSARYMHGITKSIGAEYNSNLRVGIDYTFGKK